MNNLITKGFKLAGILNISGVLMFSRFFTNRAIYDTDPNAMSKFGLLMIIVWGLAFIASSKKHKDLKWLVGVFAIEKLVYSIYWTFWILKNDLIPIYQQDLMAGFFYTVYGLNDWLFFLFFTFVFFKPIIKTKS
jgi:hypothetical protein